MTALTLFAFLVASPVWAGPSAEDLRKIQTARRARLPDRVNTLAESALRAYLDAGRPTREPEILRAMEATDATSFLPDIEAMLTVQDPAIPEADLKEIRAIAERARAQGRLSYLEMQKALEVYLGRTNSVADRAIGFPMQLVYSAAHGFNEDEITDVFLHEKFPVEVSQAPKEADGVLRASRLHGDHDLDHADNFLESIKAIPAERRFEWMVQQELLRIELDEKAAQLGVRRARFRLFHERDNTSALQGVLTRVKTTEGRAHLLENAIAQETAGLAPPLSDQERGLEASLIRAFAHPESQIRGRSAQALLKFSPTLTPQARAAVVQAMAGNDRALQNAIAKNLIEAHLRDFSRDELGAFVNAFLEKFDLLDATGSHDTLKWLSRDPRAADALDDASRKRLKRMSDGGQEELRSLASAILRPKPCFPLHLEAIKPPLGKRD